MTPPDSRDLVKQYTGTVVVDAVMALAVIAIATRPAEGDTISEAAKTVLRVVEAARLLCAVGPDQPFVWLTPGEQGSLRLLLDLYVVPPDADA